jgi:biopolymer transport protein ExbD
MAGGGSGNDKQGIYEVNMTPLIDVSLVLVVILMVATPMALQSSISLQRAGSQAAQATVESKPETRIEVEIEAEDRILVNGTAVPRAALRATVKALVAAHPKAPVLVACAGAATHGTFVYALDEAKQAGAAHVAVVGGGKHAPAP